MTGVSARFGRSVRRRDGSDDRLGRRRRSRWKTGRGPTQIVQGLHRLRTETLALQFLDRAFFEPIGELDFLDIIGDLPVVLFELNRRAEKAQELLDRHPHLGDAGEGERKRERDNPKKHGYYYSKHRLRHDGRKFP